MDRRLLYGAKSHFQWRLGLLVARFILVSTYPDKGVKEAKYRDVPWDFLITAVGPKCGNNGVYQAWM